MRFITLTSCLIAGFLCSMPIVFASPKSFTSDLEKLSYVVGLNIGHDLRRAGIDSIEPTIVAEALAAYLADEEMAMTRDEAAVYLSGVIQETKKRKEELALRQSEEWLLSNSMQEGVIVTDSGLQYRIIAEGEGAQPGPEDKIRVVYSGKLTDGTVIDQPSGPRDLDMKYVIAGWQEGIPLMKEGATYQFFVHPNLAYGTGNVMNPNFTDVNQVLIFEVELLEINPE